VTIDRHNSARFERRARRSTTSEAVHSVAVQRTGSFATAAGGARGARGERRGELGVIKFKSFCPSSVSFFLSSSSSSR